MNLLDMSWIEFGRFAAERTTRNHAEREYRDVGKSVNRKNRFPQSRKFLVLPSVRKRRRTLSLPLWVVSVRVRDLGVQSHCHAASVSQTRAPAFPLCGAALVLPAGAAAAQEG